MISAVTRQGLDQVLGRLGTLVREARAAEPDPEPYVTLRPVEEGFAVVRDDDGSWRVSGRSAERVVAMADLTNVEAMEYVQYRLRKMGVEKALARAGAREGDLVRIGPVELDYQEGHRLMAGASPTGDARTAVVKVGTSSITSEHGELDDASLRKLGEELAAARAAGHEIVLVCSGAIAAGLPALGLATRPTDIGTLQAVAAVGQPRLMERIGAILGTHGLLAGQVLLTPHDFGVRSQYLHARETLRRLLDLGVVPVVNENDTVADDEIRYGDNDRLAALVSHLVGRRRAGAAHRHVRRVHRRPAAGGRGVADRGDRRGRRRARSGRRRRRHGSGERRHGQQARGGEDRRVVGGAGGDRGGRRAATW